MDGKNRCNKKWFFSRMWLPLLILALGASFPMARVLCDPLGSLPGSEAGDVYKHAWPYWHSLAQISRGVWPNTPCLHAPQGGILLDVMLIPSLLLAPVTLLWGPVLSSNLWVWLSLVLVGLAVYALARHLTGSSAGALCAALLAQTSPSILGQALTSGVHERLAAWVFPLLVLVLVRRLETRAWKWPLLGLLSMAFVAWHCPTFAVLASVMLALLALLLVSPIPWRRDTMARAKGRAMLLAPLLLGMALLLGVSFLAVRWFVTQPDFLAGVPTSRVDASTGVTAPLLEVATFRGLLDPFSVRIQPPKLYDDELYNLSYPGWVLLLSASSGMFLAWRRGARVSAAVVGTGFLFLLFSVGPFLFIGDSAVENPFYMAAANLLPFLGSLPAAWQQVFVFNTIGAVGLAELVRRMPATRSRVMLAILLLAAGLGERALVLPVPLVAARADARISSIYDHAQGEGVLADVPRVWRSRSLTRGTMFLAQTRHGHPIPVAINLGMTRWDDYLPYKSGISANWGQAAACMRDGGFRWLVVHTDWFAEATRASQCVEDLGRALGPPVFSTAREVLFDLSLLPAEAATTDLGCPAS